MMQDIKTVLLYYSDVNNFGIFEDGGWYEIVEADGEILPFGTKAKEMLGIIDETLLNKTE